MRILFVGDVFGQAGRRIVGEHLGQVIEQRVGRLLEFEQGRQLAKGRQNKEIATELWISERTVKFHVSAILAKLGVGNRTEAVSKAAQLGLIDL